MSTSSKRCPATDLKIRTVIWAVVTQVWPLLVVLVAFFAMALVWSARSGDWVLTEMIWVLLVKPTSLGLVASFALHESTHVIALKKIRTVTHIAIERTVWRTSVIPEGVMTGWQTVVVALAGPSSCVALGTLLWLPNLDRSLAWWYFAHIVFLLPFFGDGRSVLEGVRAVQKEPPQPSS
ncbi:hypothetical protein ACX6XY_13770 [Streptomyces sp. O3]